MKVFYGIRDNILVDCEDLTADVNLVFDTPLEEKYIKNINFNDDFANELQRVFVDVNRENFFDLAVDPNSTVANYSDSVEILTLDYDDPVLTAFLMETFRLGCPNFVVTSRKVQVLVVSGEVALWFYVEGYSANKSNQYGEIGYVFSVELTEDEIALLYKLVW